MNKDLWEKVTEKANKEYARIKLKQAEKNFKFLRYPNYFCPFGNEQREYQDRAINALAEYERNKDGGKSE